MSSLFSTSQLFSHFEVHNKKKNVFLLLSFFPQPLAPILFHSDVSNCAPLRFFDVDCAMYEIVSPYLWKECLSWSKLTDTNQLQPFWQTLLREMSQHSNTDEQLIPLKCHCKNPPHHILRNPKWVTFGNVQQSDSTCRNDPLVIWVLPFQVNLTWQKIIDLRILPKEIN